MIFPLIQSSLKRNLYDINMWTIKKEAKKKKLYSFLETKFSRLNFAYDLPN